MLNPLSYLGSCLELKCVVCYFSVQKILKIEHSFKTEKCFVLLRSQNLEIEHAERMKFFKMEKYIILKCQNALQKAFKCL